MTQSGSCFWAQGSIIRILKSIKWYELEKKNLPFRKSPWLLEPIRLFWWSFPKVNRTGMIFKPYFSSLIILKINKKNKNLPIYFGIKIVIKYNYNILAISLKTSLIFYFPSAPSLEITLYSHTISLLKYYWIF